MSACVQGGVCASLLASLGVVTHTMVMREGVTGSAVISVKLIPQPVTGLSAIVIHPNADTHTHTNTGAIESNVQSRRHWRGFLSLSVSLSFCLTHAHKHADTLTHTHDKTGAERRE